MRNRAKCKLCESVIESYHSTDYCECKCGEIGVDGGEALRCCAKSWSNFIRVEDDDSETIVRVEELTRYEKADMEINTLNKLDKEKETESKKNDQAQYAQPQKKHIIGMLDNMIREYDQLPQHAMNAPISHYDFLSLLLLISALAKDDIS